MNAMASSSGGARDRTAEFLSIADRLRKEQQASSSGANGDAGAAGAAPSARAGLGMRGGYSPTPATQSEFNRRASGIGLGIHGASAKLQRLAALAKRTSMFDDPAAEIADLTAVIKQDITMLNGAISDLQSLSDARSRQANQHTAKVVDNLKAKLMGATQGFKDVLTLRTEALKQHDSRRHIFSAGAGAASAGRGLAARGRASAGLFGGLGKNALALSGEGGLPTHHTASGAVGSQQATMAVQGNDSYLASRQAALQNVERTIAELGGIFTQLAAMVAEQGELAVRLDENLEDAAGNVDGAHAQLQKYYDGISGNRWLILKVFGVLMFFLTFFIMFVV